MTVTWTEWSDCKLTLHENRRGTAEETRLGEVFMKSEGVWVFKSADERVMGTRTNRDAAQKALVSQLSASLFGTD